jgi:hypothetical protein
MNSEGIGNDILRLPRLSNTNSAQGMYDNRNKLFYPHYPAHLNTLHYEEPKHVRIRPGKSKSVVSLE